jgi:hypothetical protein
LAPTQWLDGKHTIFGRVAKGMKIVANMGMVKTNARDIPKDKVSVSHFLMLQENLLLFVDKTGVSDGHRRKTRPACLTRTRALETADCLKFILG